MHNFINPTQAPTEDEKREKKKKMEEGKLKCGVLSTTIAKTKQAQTKTSQKRFKSWLHSLFYRQNFAGLLLCHSILNETTIQLIFKSTTRINSHFCTCVVFGCRIVSSSQLNISEIWYS